MTRIEFYFNVDNKLQKVVDLSVNVLGRGRKLMLFAADSESVARLEHLLWAAEPTSFLPHCRAEHALAQVTPVVIGYSADQLPHDDVLINLRREHPPFFSRFRRLIEIVSVEEEDKVAARARYRFYRDRGYEIRSFDVNGSAL